jgi:ferric enterobactin receptor
MKNLYFIFLTIAILPAFAQRVPISYSVKGNLIDSLSQKPASSITVILKSLKNQFSIYTLTASDGSFKFDKQVAGSYSLMVSSINYNSKVLPVKLTDSLTSSVNFPRILLTPKTKDLKEVVIKTRKSIIKVGTDKLVYNLQADPESNSKNLLEIMRKVPLLSIDGADNILLKGSSSYKIFINGKPSSMMEGNANAVLRSLAASNVQSIEVITNPSSKYDSEGIGGIINIITKKSIDNGYNASINVNETAPAGGPGGSGLFALKEGKFGVSILGGAKRDISPNTNTLKSRATTGENESTLIQTGINKTKNNNKYVNADLSYEIDSLNLISLQLNLNDNSKDAFGNESSHFEGNNVSKSSYDLNSSRKSGDNGMDAALNYQLGFKSDKDRLLTFSYRYLKYSNDLNNRLDVSNAINYNQPDYNQTNNGSFKEQTIQLDYVQTLKNGLNIEAGLKSILRNNKSDFQNYLFNSATGQFELDNTSANKFYNNQNVFAAYNTYQYKIKNWVFKAGARIEQTVVKADFVSNASEVKQNYFNINPTLKVTKVIDDLNSVSLNYTGRIQRPAINQLNPFVDRSNPIFEFSGNPNLKPTLTHIFNLDYTKSGNTFINVSFGYVFFNSLIGPISRYDNLTNITLTTFENMGKGRVVKSNIYINQPINKNWNISLNSDIRYGSFSIVLNDKQVKNEGLMHYVDLSTGYRFDKGWNVNASIANRGRDISSAQVTYNGYTSCSFSVSKEIVKSKLYFSCAVNNPFTEFRHRYETTLGSDFTQLIDNQVYFRSFSFNLNYKFGKLKDAIKKNKRSINNNDVVN